MCLGATIACAVLPGTLHRPEDMSGTPKLSITGCTEHSAFVMLPICQYAAVVFAGLLLDHSAVPSISDTTALTC